MGEAWTLPEPKTFYDVRNCKQRTSINQGGSRSGKTYSICKVLIAYALVNANSEPSIVTVCRKTLPALRATVYRDFFEILHAEGLYNAKNHNKSNFEYVLGNTLFEFISIDNPQKVRGRKRNICFINEANEITFEDYRQLNMRTSQLMIIDYNPSEEFWAHTELIGQPDVEFNRTWYIHNPYIDPNVKAEIIKLKDKDPNYWRIYGLGELGIIEGLVYPRYEVIDSWPEGIEYFGYGQDFGYTNDQSALIQVAVKDDKLFLNELIYKTGLTNTDLCREYERLGISKRHKIVADSAEPKSIEEIRRTGYFIEGALKGPDSLLNGIDIMKRYKLIVTAQSVNLIKELKNYKWQQDRNLKWQNQPIDAFNHALDAARYWCLNNLNVTAPKARLISY